MRIYFFEIRALSILLSLCMLTSWICSCSVKNEDVPLQTTPFEDTTEEQPQASPPPPVGESSVLELKWNFGFVAAHDYAASPNSIVEKGEFYSYTDVFVVPFAGTTITFTDDNTNSNNDKEFATFAQFVISSWKKVGTRWVLDLDSLNNYTGIAPPNSDIANISNGAAVYTYTTSENNECLRLCYRSGQTAAFTPSAYPEVTATYTAQPGTSSKKAQLNDWVKSTGNDYYCKSLEGLTVNAIGDSYFAGDGLDRDYMWLSMLETKYGMEVNNYGINGSMMSNFTGYGNPICKRYANMPDNSPDIVIVEGGRNDFNNSTPIGTVDSRDDTTFMGAINVTIDGIKAKYPGAMIVCITAWNFTATKNGMSYKNYAAAMKNVAKAQGVYCIDASDPKVSGVDMASSAFRKKHCMRSSDESHLNLEGMKVVFPNFDKLLGQYYEDFLASKQ